LFNANGISGEVVNKR